MLFLFFCFFLGVIAFLGINNQMKVGQRKGLAKKIDLKNNPFDFNRSKFKAWVKFYGIRLRGFQVLLKTIVET